MLIIKTNTLIIIKLVIIKYDMFRGYYLTIDLYYAKSDNCKRKKGHLYLIWCMEHDITHFISKVIVGQSMIILV